jgi:hypothetical protein
LALFNEIILQLGFKHQSFAFEPASVDDVALWIVESHIELVVALAYNKHAD